MYVRHLAWLHAVPDDGLKKSRLSNFRELDDNHPLLKLPDIESEYGAGFIIGLLHESGLMSSNGMGPVPLSWVDIESWVRCVEYDLPIWIKLLIRTLSEEYVHELLEARSVDRQPPYEEIAQIEDDDEAIQIQRSNVQNKLLSLVARIKEKPQE